MSSLMLMSSLKKLSFLTHSRPTDQVKPQDSEWRQTVGVQCLTVKLNEVSGGLPEQCKSRYFGIFRGKKRWQIFFFMYFKNLKYTTKQVLHRIKFVF